MSFGSRLRAERERHEFTQVAFAEALGTSQKSQTNYETGKQMPGSGYLLGAARLGVDLNYVFTGIRSVLKPGMTAEEIEQFNRCVDAFWDLDSAQRVSFLLQMEAVARKKLDKEGETRGMRRPKPRT